MVSLEGFGLCGLGHVAAALDWSCGVAGLMSGTSRTCVQTRLQVPETVTPGPVPCTSPSKSRLPPVVHHYGNSAAAPESVKRSTTIRLGATIPRPVARLVPKVKSSSSDCCVMEQDDNCGTHYDARRRTMVKEIQ